MLWVNMVYAALSSDGGCSSAGRAPGCDPGCRGFEPRQPPQSFQARCVLHLAFLFGLNVKLGSGRRVVGGFCCLGDGSFSYSDVVAVAGWDSVVIESWSSCFLVGFVLDRFSQDWYFCELILTKPVLLGDF